MLGLRLIIPATFTLGISRKTRYFSKCNLSSIQSNEKPNPVNNRNRLSEESGNFFLEQDNPDLEPIKTQTSVDNRHFKREHAQPGSQRSVPGAADLRVPEGNLPLPNRLPKRSLNY
jgi:hypothetical protein